MSIKGTKVGQKGRINEFHFRHEIDPHYYLHATWAFPEDLEIFDDFNHMFDLTFEPFLNPQNGYDPVRQKIWIVNTIIWPTEHSWAANIGVSTSFGLHL